MPQIEAGILIPKETDADTNYKMNPPLRTKEDVEALKEGLRDNIMDVISTDHAPHTFDDKNTSMKKAPFGIVGLEYGCICQYLIPFHHALLQGIERRILAVIDHTRIAHRHSFLEIIRYQPIPHE